VALKQDIQQLIKIQKKGKDAKKEEEPEDNFDSESLASIFSQSDDEESAQLGKRAAP
jgi:hypothetical protein